jgi:hypothetical protein
MDTKFIIFEHQYAHLIDFSEVKETSIDTLRVSSLGNTFVKYEGNIPVFTYEIPNCSIEYSYEEILEILKSPEWINEI